LGNGTFGLAPASVPNVDNPKATARVVANPVDRTAAERRDEVNAFPPGESFEGASLISIRLNLRTKYQSTRGEGYVCACSTAKSRPPAGKPQPARVFRLVVRPDMSPM
jgi:hypothetical protein